MTRISALNLQSTSIIFTMSPDVVKLYMYLLSDSFSTKKKDIVSNIEFSTLPHKYLKCVQILEDAKLIHTHKASDNIYLGEEGQLFANAQNILSSLKEELTNIHKTYATKRRYNVDIMTGWEKANKFISNLESIKRGYDLLQIYVGVYGLVNRHAPDREFTGKELGQLNGLLRMYGPEKATQLVIYYLLNYTEETTYPTIAQLIGQKDALFSAMVKKTVNTPETHLDTDADDF